MPKVRMDDVVILLPGITGSVLQKDGQDVWAVSGQAGWRFLSSLGHSMDDLRLAGDDPEAPVLDDGITASRVIKEPHFIPGLSKIDGYTALVPLITEVFDVEIATGDPTTPANFFEFPYDWRRDVRAAAHALKRLIDERLSQWREYTNIRDAKVIVLAHSLGGLIARYCLEALEGWRDCRALITFGTPYRGSVNALDFLANGYRRLFVDLSEVMRTFTSVHQLLPRYRMLDVAGRWQRVGETDAVSGVDHAMARNALQFHRDLDEVVERNRKDLAYGDYQILPVVGTRQPTLQSARLHNGKVQASRDLPSGIDPLLADGDGTVPRLSAIPIELSDAYRDTFYAERHSALQKNALVLDALAHRLTQSQVRALGQVRGASISQEAAVRPALSVDVGDLYLTGEPVELRAALVNLNDIPRVAASIKPADAAGPSTTVELAPDTQDWRAAVEGLPPGLYQLEVEASGIAAAPPPVHDLFGVVEVA